MRNIFVASAFSVAALFATSTAQAQGASNPFNWSAPTAVNWTGFYIGGQGSYQWSGVDVSFEHELPGLGTGANLSTDGWMGGVHGGVQQQIGRWVFGVDLSADWGKNSGSASQPWTVGPGIECIRFVGCFGFEAAGSDSIRASLDRLFTASGRLGYAWDNWLVYAKGGYASAKISTASHLTGEAEGCLFACAGFSWDASGTTEKTHQGWTLGGGFAVMIARNVSFGVDYNYIRLGAETHRGTLTGELDFCDRCDFAFEKDYEHRVDPDDIHMVSARLTFHFNSPPEPAESLK